MAAEDSTVTERGEALLLITAMSVVNLCAALVLIMFTLISHPALFQSLALLLVGLLIVAVLCSEVAASRIVRRIGLDKAGFLPFQYLRPRYLHQALAIASPRTRSAAALGAVFFLFPLGVGTAILLMMVVS